jgi:hypothetical protein
VEGVDPLWCWAHYADIQIMPISGPKALVAAVPAVMKSA